MSKLIFFDFDCPEHGLFEDLVTPDIRQAPCPRCNQNAPRCLSNFRIDHMRMAASDSASPESISKFERAHRQQKAKEERCEAEHGDYGRMAGS